MLISYLRQGGFSRPFTSWSWIDSGRWWENRQRRFFRKFPRSSKITYVPYALANWRPELIWEWMFTKFRCSVYWRCVDHLSLPRIWFSKKFPLLRQTNIKARWSAKKIATGENANQNRGICYRDIALINLVKYQSLYAGGLKSNFIN